MTVKQKVMSRYVLASTLGIISKNDFKEKVPELFKAYEGVYGNSRPDIKIIASEHYTFPAEKYSQGSWHVTFAFHNGEVRAVPVEKYFGKTEQLQPDSMILDCITGNFNACYLYVHPQNATPLISGDTELTEKEETVLGCMATLKPGYREKEYYQTMYKKWEDQLAAEKAGEYKAIMKALADKGLVKLNAAGSGQLTLEGKNRAIRVKKKW